MSIANSTLPLIATDPSAFASMLGLVGATLTWMVLKAIEQASRP